MLFGVEIKVEGPFAFQPPLVKLGVALLGLAATALLILLPIAVGAAILAGVGTPAPGTPGLAAKLAPFGLLLAMLSVGFWINNRMLREISAGRLGLAARSISFMAIALASAGISAGAAALHVLPLLCVLTMALVVLAALLASLMIVAGQAIARRPSRASHTPDISRVSVRP
jgi:hypothetical protein